MDLETDRTQDLTGELIAGCLKALGALPLPVIQTIGNITGHLLWAFNADARRVTQINIDTCFADKPKSWRKELAKKSIIQTAITACEMGAVWTKDVDIPLNKVQKVEGLKLIQDALDQGKGVVILAPHLGNWEILGNFISQKYPLTNLYQPPDHEALHKLIYAARTRSGAKLAPTNRRGVIQIVRALRKGELTGILPDQEPDRESGSAYVPFFGKDALTGTIIPKLVNDTNSIAIGGFCLRKDNHYEIFFRPVLDGIYSDDLVKATASMNKSIENFVLECPEQYQWEYKRFKRRPTGEERLYNPGKIAR